MSKPPPPPTRDLKQDRAVRTRAQVLAAAAQAFASRGYPPVTVLDVAELAGVTKGAVYFHFTNKEALAQAVAADFYHQLTTIAEAVKTEQLPPLDAVAQLLMRTAHAFRDNTTIQAGARLQIERATISTDLPIPYIGYLEIVTHSFRNAKEAGQLNTSTDPDSLARVLVSAFFGAQHISWILNNRTDITQRVKEILTTIIPQ